MAAALLKTDFTMNNLGELPEMLKTVLGSYIPGYKQIFCNGFCSLQIDLLEGITNPVLFVLFLFLGVCRANVLISFKNTL